MAQTKYKFKVGDLVRQCNEETSFYYGLGIIVEPRYRFTLGPAYIIFWTKRGLDWYFEKQLVKVNDNDNI